MLAKEHIQSAIGHAIAAVVALLALVHPGFTVPANVSVYVPMACVFASGAIALAYNLATPGLKRQMATLGTAVVAAVDAAANAASDTTAIAPSSKSVADQLRQAANALEGK